MTNVLAKALSLASVAALTATGFGAAAVAGPAHTSHLKATHLTLKSTQARVTKNDKFKATVVGKLRSHKAPLADETVALEQRAKAGKNWTPTDTSLTTDSDGKVTVTFTQSAVRQQYRLVFAGDSGYKKTHSGTITIHRSRGTTTTGS